MMRSSTSTKKIEPSDHQLPVDVLSLAKLSAQSSTDGTSLHDASRTSASSPFPPIRRRGEPWGAAAVGSHHRGERRRGEPPPHAPLFPAPHPLPLLPLTRRSSPPPPPSSPWHMAADHGRRNHGEVLRRALLLPVSLTPAPPHTTPCR
jgi:hypothetical protein